MSKRLPLPAVVVALLAALALAGSASAYSPGPAAGRVMGGLTKQGWPVVIAVSKNARVAAFIVGVDMTCSAGDDFSTQDGFPRVVIRRDGRMSVNQAIAPSGSVLGGHHSLRGRLNRRAARFAGTWELHVDFAMSNGQVDSCDSGTVPIRAVL